MKFSVRVSLGLALVMLLAMVNAEPKPKTYLLKTGDKEDKARSLVIPVPPPCKDNIDCLGDQRCEDVNPRFGWRTCLCNMPNHPAYADCSRERCNLCQCAPCKPSEACSVRSVGKYEIERVCKPLCRKDVDCDIASGEMCENGVCEQQNGPLPDDFCICYNPFTGTDHSYLGDPDANCDQQNMCYVRPNAKCRDKKPAAGTDRWFSGKACEARRGNILHRSGAV